MTSRPEPSYDDEPGGDAGPDLEIDEELYEPPWSIVTAVRLMWTGAVLSILVPAIGYLSTNSIKANIAAQLREQHNYSAGEVDSIYRNVLLSTLIVAAAAGAVWLLMARVNGAGRRWGRSVATALGAVNILEFSIALSQGEITSLQLALSAVSILVAVVVLVLLWLPDSADYYYLQTYRRTADER